MIRYGFLLFFTEKKIFISFLFTDGTKFKARSTGIGGDGTMMNRNGQILPMPLGEPHLSVDYEECEDIKKILY